MDQLIGGLDLKPGNTLTSRIPDIMRMKAKKVILTVKDSEKMGDKTYHVVEVVVTKTKQTKPHIG